VTLILVGIGCFVLGIACGVLLRDAYELTAHGEGFIMATVSAIVHRFGARRILTMLLLVALIVNAVVGFALIGARAKADRAERTANAATEDLTALTNCLETYNRLEGDARNERDDVAKRITATEVVLWRTIRSVFEGDDPNAGEVVLDAIEEYLRNIRALQSIRLESPYPDPALCLPRRAG
jgi:hypothetical protein